MNILPVIFMKALSSTQAICRVQFGLLNMDAKKFHCSNLYHNVAPFRQTVLCGAESLRDFGFEETDIFEEIDILEVPEVHAPLRVDLKGNCL